MAYLILFVFGLAVGSFLNVVALRYIRLLQDCKLQNCKINSVSQSNKKSFNLSIFQSFNLLCGGRSKCPVCDETLIWYELIPIFSFLIQKGKCRRCGHRISLQYPLVEILTGIIFVAIPFTNYQLPITVIWIFIFLLFLLLSIIDFRRYIIPNSINLSLAVLGSLLVIASVAKQSYSQWSMVNSQRSFLGHYAALFDFWPSSIVSSQWSIVINHTFAAFIAMLFFGAIILLTKGKAMGWGDFKLVGALGLIFGWPDILIVLFLAFIIGAAFSIILLIRKKKKIKEAVPFGPFLIIGASLTFFFGYQIINGYFKLFDL